jgi:NADH-quinone oxidoreductase subunit I
MGQLVKQFVAGIYNLLVGLFTTGKHLGRHAVTIQYPKERWTMPERSRGMVVLLTDEETGLLNCTACLLCMRACPSGAIEIETAEDEKGKRVRYPKGFTLNYHICCFCGLCEESCNFSAIKLTPKYEFPEWDSQKLIWSRDKLQEMGRDVTFESQDRKKNPDERVEAAALADGRPVPADVLERIAAAERAKAEAKAKAAEKAKAEAKAKAAEKGKTEAAETAKAKQEDASGNSDAAGNKAESSDKTDDDSKEDTPS